MKRLIGIILIAILIYLVQSACNQRQEMHWIMQAPAGSLYTHIDKEDITIIPNGRFLTPRGYQIQVAPHPYGLTLSRDGQIVVTANSGVRPFSITVINKVLSGEPEIKQIPPGAQTDKGILAAVFMGLAITKDNSRVYVAGGQENTIYIFDLRSGIQVGQIDCAVKNDHVVYSHGYIGDMILSKDGKRLYAVDQINFRMIICDTENQNIMNNVKVGRYPFGITLSPDETTAYVANVGMYEYSLIENVDNTETDNLKREALHYPPFAYLSPESRDGIYNDSMKVPGLGEPNAPESFSVWKIRLDRSENPKVTAKIKTGILVGQIIEDFPAVGGASPNSVVATEKYAFVSNGNNDCISVIDVKQDTVIKNIFLKLDERLGNLRGVIPFGLALSPDYRRLYVAESGINAVAVIDVASLQVVGHIPVGWFPSKLAVSPDGTKLIIANAKGFGSGPNAGPDFIEGPEGSYVGNLMKGTVSIIEIPTDDFLKQETAQVVANNFTFLDPAAQELRQRENNPIPLYPGQKKSPIKHIVFISKENRTYDEVFGQVKKGRGMPGLARYGHHATFSNKDQTRRVEDATVMPNHLKLAAQFAISDNFYCDSDHSADGHRWLVNTYPNEWVETSVSTSYGGGRRMRNDSKAPGNFAFVGATGAIYPEDYNEAGSIWEHMDRNNIDFFNFGFGLELAPSLSDKTFKYTGVRYVINYPVPTPIFNKSSKLYATYNMGIPDQFRVDMFIKEFEERWLGKDKHMPAVLTIILPNDHGAGERPDDGYPYNESYMADNDLGLGRLVQFLSSTPYWENMAIFVTEDDPQGGVDHVDAHRSLLMVISPYANRNYVSHVHYSFGSIFKTFWNILNLPYLNQYDAGATDLNDCFTDMPDFSPYNALAVDKRIFDPQKALDPYDVNFDWDAVVESPVIDYPPDMERRSREEAKMRAKK